MTRAPGFYWVHDAAEGWIVAEYQTGNTLDFYNGWWLCGADFPFKESEFVEIDERRIERVTP